MYLDPGFPADLADRALRFVQIVKEFVDAGGPTPAASTIISANDSGLKTGVAGTPVPKLPCVWVSTGATKVWVEIPRDRDAIWGCLQQYASAERRRELPHVEPRFSKFYTSKTGLRLQGILRILGGVSSARRLFEDYYWQRVFLTLAGVARNAVEKRTSHAERLLADFFKENREPDFCRRHPRIRARASLQPAIRNAPRKTRGRNDARASDLVRTMEGRRDSCRWQSSRMVESSQFVRRLATLRVGSPP